MSIEQIRARIVASIWQAVAQSGVDVSALPRENQEKLFSKIADGLLVTVNEMMEETVEPEAEENLVDDPTVEKVLWQGRPFASLVERYALTSERLKIITGLMARRVENFELIRIQDIDFTQGMTERMMNIGDVTIRGHDQSNQMIVLRNVRDPEKVYEVMRKAWLEARKRHGLQFREYM